ncbi:MAG: AAA+ family ATPase, partial [Desulfobulbaceae bacterium]|nr:AAA+ family ATPase [Desulfobulbaceae bacterium]
LLVPVQATPQSQVSWEVIRLTGQEKLAERACKKLRSEEMFLVAFAPTRLRMELDRVPLWRGEHVAVKQLIEDFARYLYLPRLKDSGLLTAAVASGPATINWEKDGFAYADSFDENAQRYRGLRYANLIANVDAAGVVVKPQTAQKQITEERVVAETSTAYVAPTVKNNTMSSEPAVPVADTSTSENIKPKRFHGSVSLDPTRLGRDAGQVGEEVIAHLAGIVGAQVKVTLEIEADIPNGASDEIVRIITENSRTLKFTSQGFERE